MSLKDDIDVLLKPIEFAAKNNFANLEKVKNLHELILDFLKKNKNNFNINEKETLILLEKGFLSFNDLQFEEKKKLINDLISFLHIDLVIEKKIEKTEKERKARVDRKIKEVRDEKKGAAEKTFQEEKTFDAKKFSDEQYVSVTFTDESLEQDFFKVGTSLQKVLTPVNYVKGVGPKIAEIFKKKNINTIDDLFYFFPTRYEDREKNRKIRDVREGEDVFLEGKILLSGETRYGRRKVYEAILSDGNGTIKLKWFNFRTPYMNKKYTKDVNVKVYGTVKAFGRSLEIIHPDVEFLNDSASDENEEEVKLDFDFYNNLIPIYSQTGSLHQKTIRKIMRNLIENHLDQEVSALPIDIINKHSLLPAKKALHALHVPGSYKNEKNIMARANRSLAFEELFLLEAGLFIKKRNYKKEEGISYSALSGELKEKFFSLLPFDLTGDQKKSIKEIEHDMKEIYPMNRLLQGDVGSGKTIVSFVSALNAKECGYQSAIMAPTEILAEQHYINFKKYEKDLGIKVGFLKSALKKKERNEVLEKLQNGEIDILVGTHALISDDVVFKNLGFIVIDEQHRFGVLQRAKLRNKAGICPDILIMSATPIPRTLSMTLFGDLDVSIIKEMPKGRKPVKTHLYREKESNDVFAHALDELKKGGQVYVVYPLIEESEKSDLKDATSMFEKLKQGFFADYNVELLHGKMKSVEKEKIMADFKDNKVQVLVSTTVIEVGVDVPNANCMIIEHGERFGLSQLHQLRGRVGRGGRESYCYIIAPDFVPKETYIRLKVMERTTDGFLIAEEDMKLRGPGDFFGARQSGIPYFRFIEALTDTSLIKKVREEAFKFMEKDVNLTSDEGKIIKEFLLTKWSSRLDLAETG